jgi:hypothetical protein
LAGFGLRLGRRNRRGASAQLVALLESLDAAGSVVELLLAGKEGMAASADLDREAAARRGGLIRCAACTGDGGELVVRMDESFGHDASVPQKEHIT